jgi:hypothetical protein
MHKQASIQGRSESMHPRACSSLHTVPFSSRLQPWRAEIVAHHFGSPHFRLPLASPNSTPALSSASMLLAAADPVPAVPDAQRPARLQLARPRAANPRPSDGPSPAPTAYRCWMSADSPPGIQVGNPPIQLRLRCEGCCPKQAAGERRKNTRGQTTVTAGQRTVTAAE